MRRAINPTSRDWYRHSAARASGKPAAMHPAARLPQAGGAGLRENRSRMRRQPARQLLEQAPEEILPGVAFDAADLAAFVGDDEGRGEEHRANERDGGRRVAVEIDGAQRQQPAEVALRIGGPDRLVPGLAPGTARPPVHEKLRGLRLDGKAEQQERAEEEAFQQRVTPALSATLALI